MPLARFLQLPPVSLPPKRLIEKVIVMESKLRIFPEPMERLPALILAALATFLLLAAINAGFTAQATDPRVPAGNLVTDASGV